MTTAKQPGPRQLTQAFEDAFIYANRLHAAQARKGSDIPYVTHLMSVAALVLEFGGSQEQAIAALLHDCIEDQGHGNPERLRNEIRLRFGQEVLDIVEDCTDTDQDPKPAWPIRKQAYIDRLSREDGPALLVAIADKLHNARCMLVDYRTCGDTLRSRFNAPRERQVWYLESVADAVEGRAPVELLRELRQIIDELRPVET
jgi:(p)ppGpp synthase/HD superfamily hydrolase